jgi:hypothetical protein
MRSAALVAPFVALVPVVAGCATVEAPRIVGPEPAVVWEDAGPSQASSEPAPITVDEARSIALAHDAAHSCETTARQVASKDKARGWAIMQECVQRPDFSDLETLLASPWIDEVRASPEAAAMVAHVMAVRGGDVENDLRLVRRAKMPLFSLKAAIADPDSYAGRLIVMRGSPASGRTVNGARALEINETKVMAESAWVSSGPRLSSSTSTDQIDNSGNNMRPGLRERFNRSEGAKVEVERNVPVETGLSILAQVNGEPFLEPGSDYVLVLRFDGTRETITGTVTEDQPVATVVGYFEPETGLFARLGR